VISGRLKSTFPTNWELSTARASNVVRFLQDSVGIEPTRLQAVGLSQYHPVASNATVQGRSQNRRIEIALLPMPAGEQ
jgi:chemotaxis protein MotB